MLFFGCPTRSRFCFTPPRSRRFANERLVEAELPKGLYNVVIGRGDVVGTEIVRNPDVAKTSFTGSVAVGKSIMRDGAATMKRVALELGGKSPNILLDDADLDKAIPTTLAIALVNSGQACLAGCRGRLADVHNHPSF